MTIEKVEEKIISNTEAKVLFAARKEKIWLEATFVNINDSEKKSRQSGPIRWIKDRLII